MLVAQQSVFCEYVKIGTFYQVRDVGVIKSIGKSCEESFEGVKTLAKHTIDQGALSKYEL